MSLEWYYTLQDEHTKAWGAYSTSTRWFGLRVDIISAIFVGIVAFTAIPLANGEYAVQDMFYEIVIILA